MIMQFWILLIELRQVLNSYRPGYLTYAKNTDNMLNEHLPFDLPIEYQSFHKEIWGTSLIDVPNEWIDITPGYRILPFLEAIELYNSELWTDYRSKEFFPFISDFFGNYVVFQKNKMYLLEVSHDIPEVYIKYDSLRAFVETMIDEYKSNFFINDQTGLIDCDIDKSFEIWRKHNPNSNFYCE